MDNDGIKGAAAQVRSTIKQAIAKITGDHRFLTAPLQADAVVTRVEAGPQPAGDARQPLGTDQTPLAQEQAP